jgi:hypothetical protein
MKEKEAPKDSAFWAGMVFWLFIFVSCLSFWWFRADVNDRLREAAEAGVKLDLVRSENPIGECFVPFADKWVKFTKDDILDEVDNKIKIDCSCSVRPDGFPYDVPYISTNEWFKKEDIIFYGDIWKDKRARIEKRLKQ